MPADGRCCSLQPRGLQTPHPSPARRATRSSPAGCSPEGAQVTGPVVAEPGGEQGKPCLCPWTLLIPTEGTELGCGAWAGPGQAGSGSSELCPSFSFPPAGTEMPLLEGLKGLVGGFAAAGLLCACKSRSLPPWQRGEENLCTAARPDGMQACPGTCPFQPGFTPRRAPGDPGACDAPKSLCSGSTGVLSALGWALDRLHTEPGELTCHRQRALLQVPRCAAGL